MPNLAPTWRPKRLQNRGRNPEKSTSKKTRFLESILEGFGLHFGRIFWWFFEANAELILNCESKLRTLKIVIFLRKNAYFQETRESDNAKFISKMREKSMFFGAFDFGGVLRGFGEGFGSQKTMIFAIFAMFFRSKFWRNWFWTAIWTKMPIKTQIGQTWLGAPVVLELLGRDYREGSENFRWAFSDRTL